MGDNALELGFPKSIFEFLEIAENYATRFGRSQSISDLFPAVLAATHAPEWHRPWNVTIASKPPRGTKGDTVELQAFKKRYVEWNILRGICNGVKHCKLKEGDSLQSLHSRPIEYEDPNWWDEAGDLDRMIWFVDHETESYAVHVLCLNAIAKFKSDVPPDE